MLLEMRQAVREHVSLESERPDMASSRSVYSYTLVVCKMSRLPALYAWQDVLSFCM